MFSLYNPLCANGQKIAVNLLKKKSFIFQQNISQLPRIKARKKQKYDYSTHIQNFK